MSTENDIPTLLTAQEVAAMLKTRVSWVYGECRANRIPHLKLGPRYVRFDRAEIEAWIAGRRRGPTSARNTGGDA